MLILDNADHLPFDKCFTPSLPMLQKSNVIKQIPIQKAIELQQEFTSYTMLLILFNKNPDYLIEWQIFVDFFSI